MLAHAITDAIFGALAEGDIGAHFPPSDPQWKGAASSIFLAHAVERVKARGGMIAHVDATVICEAPKIGPHRDAIRASLAKILGVAEERVALKATTTEKLGLHGSRRGRCGDGDGDGAAAGVRERGGPALAKSLASPLPRKRGGTGRGLALPRQLRRAALRGLHRPGHQRRETVLPHQHGQRGGGRAAGRSDVLA